MRLFIISLMLLPSYVLADIYSFVDEAGITHYSDVADDARYTFLMSTPAEAPQAAAVPIAEQAKPEQVASNQPQTAYNEHLAQAAQDNQLDAELLHAVITVESAYNPQALSPKGAMGLMQLMPATAKRYGVINALDPQQNIKGGAKYLRELLTLFNNDTRLALAAYNSGESAVIRYGNKIPPYRETMHYVPRVMKIYEGLRKSKKING